MSTASTTARDARRTLVSAFADVLAYPHEVPAGAAAACAGVLDGAGEAQALVERFAAFASTTSLGEIQEAFTRTFDLDSMSRAEPTCHPYLGHHLFDDNHKRGAFILGLRKRYRAIGFDEGTEVADHLVVVLRFLALTGDDEEAEVIIVEALLPGLARMTLSAGGDGDAVDAGREAYLGLVRALEIVLSEGREAVDPMETESEREWLRDRDSLGIDRNLCGH